MDDRCTCHLSGATSGVYQTLDELSFEKGIWSAAQHGEIDRIERLLRKGVPVDTRDNSGYTALHYAARNGHLPVCKLLVCNRADVNAVTKAGGATALHRAATAGHLEIVNFLLENKADSTLKDSDGKTALHRAVEAQHKDVCEAILAAAPHLKIYTDNKGKKPIDYATAEDLKDTLCGL